MYKQIIPGLGLSIISYGIHQKTITLAAVEINDLSLNKFKD